ncbi:transmembrane protein 198 isoform X1 [Fukomys damarensis]|uniref:transmembrane protein 198 isoform X1 n=1 Tax=Fukomys damarensis TaxID=885580 RepID=UPI0014555C91|nr:transmembrane protein 198 isoform X1 [Fukomys damarensis]
MPPASKLHSRLSSRLDNSLLFPSKLNQPMVISSYSLSPEVQIFLYLLSANPSCLLIFPPIPSSILNTPPPSLSLSFSSSCLEVPLVCRFCLLLLWLAFLSQFSQIIPEQPPFCLSVLLASLPRLPLLQGSDVSLGLAVRSSGDLPVVPQGAGAGDTAEPGGLTLGIGALLATEPIYQPPSAWVPAGGLVGLALLGALLTLRWPRHFTILGTALLGAAVLVACADYFLEGLALGSRLGQRLQALPALPPLCWYSWVMLGTWPALGALGALAQWKLMSEERGDHANVVLSHQRRHLQLLRIHSQEAKWHRTPSGVGLCEGSYRHQLPPSVRSPADSLAPSYLQSLRDHQLGPSNLATASNTILDLDSDCGSTVPLTTPPGSTQT